MPSPVVSPDQCKIEGSSRDNRTALFDIDAARAGQFIQPLLFDDEMWPPGYLAEIVWIFVKGDLMKGIQYGRPFEMPFTHLTLFSLDLLRADDNSTVRNIMPPTNSTLFWDSGAPFGKFDGKHRMAGGFLNHHACRTKAYLVMAYYWPVPDDLDDSHAYRLRMTTDDLDTENFSGAFRLAAPKAAGLLEASGSSRHNTVLPIRGLAVFGTLFILCMALGVRFFLGRRPLQRRRQYEPLNQEAYRDVEEATKIEAGREQCKGY